MRDRIKTKLAAAFCIGCVFFFSAVSFVFAAGTLSVAVSQGTVKTGDTVTVTVYAEGAGGEEVTADLSVTYDSSKLEYVSSSASSASGGGGTVKAKGSEIDIKFKAIASGDAYVKADGATLTSAGAHITVSGAADASSSDSDAAKSGDNSLSSLKISSGTLSPSFKGSVTQYTASVGSDVNEITVTPVTSNSKATVESITGNKDLKEGTNVITVLVKAENGNQASYKITVTKGETQRASSDTGSAGVSDMAGMAAEQVKGETEGTETQTSLGGDAVEINGVKYKIEGEFPESAIPEGFSTADFEYKGTAYQGIMFDKGYLGMYYLVNEAGEGNFFIYDANRDSFYPYVRLNSGEHYIILMTVPNGVIPPENYKEEPLVLENGVSVPAYQYAGDEDTEIVKSENGDGELVSGGQSDFYIFYGMDATGVTCWYQYDSLQKTYQRFNEEAVSSEDASEDYETLANSYKELKERQKKTKISDRRLIAILIFVSVSLLILIVNLLLKIRDLKSDEEEDEEKAARKEKKNREPKRKKTFQKVQTEKKKQTAVLEPEDNKSFYEDDGADVIDEFEEDPSVLRRKPKKKEKEAKAVEVRQTEPKKQRTVEEEMFLPDDDDLEFLDLDDM